MAETREVLEPIVNTSPKELPVPEFNKKEIEKLIDNKIDAIPEVQPGTKLYKHDVTLSGDGPGKVVFINNQPNPYASMSELTSDLENHPILLSSYGNDFTSASAGASGLIQIFALTLVSDTVTEL